MEPTTSDVNDASPTVELSTLDRWAAAIASMPADSRLPSRTVLVPSEAHAHALRVQLVSRAPHALAGTRFLSAAGATRAVLDASNVTHSLGEEQFRRLRLRKLFRAGLQLTSYRSTDLHSPGWEEAFASTIEPLEAAALRPADLEALGEPRATDLATVWRALDADAGSSWTVARGMAEGRAILAANPAAWPFRGSTLAAIAVGIDTTHALFVREIPRVILGLVPGRPARDRAIDRIRSLFGDAVATHIGHVEPDREPNELGILSTFLFESPDRLASRDRPRSIGPDGSVSLETASGVDEEIDAAVRWVAEEVFDHRTPLREIAILTPTPDPLPSLIADRIAAMSWGQDVEPVYLACGRPAVATSSGARLLALVNAIAAFLPSPAVVELLPRLRLADRDGHVTPGRARTIVGTAGTLGGSETRPRDALLWRDRLLRSDADEWTRALAPAIGSLVAIAERMLENAPLGELWRAIRAFATTHVIVSKPMSDLIAQLEIAIDELADNPVSCDLAGVEAVELIATLLGDFRLQHGRFGVPSIYIGPISSAAGLSFTAVRIVGLAEGAYPGTLREDAILPRELRLRLVPYAMSSDEDYAVSRLQAFDQVVRGTGARLSLSVPRTDLDGSEREPASLFVEVAAALARPHSQGDSSPLIPTMADLERDSFSIARQAAASRRSESPLTAGCWLLATAASRDVLPSAWKASTVIDPTEVLARSLRMTGVLGPAPLSVSVLGTTELPVSASALRILLTCPQRFLLERMIGFRPRRDGPDAHRIDPASYGALFHRVAEEFSRSHGPEFAARNHDLGTWQEIADTIACVAFTTFRRDYPLLGDGVVEGELRRLRRDVRTMIEDDWDSGRPRTFVTVEHEFGKASPLSIPTTAGPLFVTGRIDRVDIEDGVTLVRDLKTGRARPRGRDHDDPEVDLDLQLALYAAVARQLAHEWSAPTDIAAAYAYIDPLALVRERSFRSDRGALRAAGERWFELATSIIREQVYVKTPDSNDCTRCPYSPVCGADTSSTVDNLRDASGTQGAFRDLKA